MEIKTAIRKNDWLKGILESDKGFANGYIGVPPGHPWHGLDYDDVPADVHGGLTYSEDRAPKEAPDGFWWLGFDTLHSGDDATTCDENYVANEIAQLKKQAEDAVC